MHLLLRDHAVVDRVAVETEFAEDVDALVATGAAAEGTAVTEVVEHDALTVMPPSGTGSCPGGGGAIVVVVVVMRVASARGSAGSSIRVGDPDAEARHTPATPPKAMADPAAMKVRREADGGVVMV